MVGAGREWGASGALVGRCHVARAKQPPSPISIIIRSAIFLLLMSLHFLQWVAAYSFATSFATSFASSKLLCAGEMALRLGSDLSAVCFFVTYELLTYVCVCVSICMSICVRIYIYIYIYIERERERDRERVKTS